MKQNTLDGFDRNIAALDAAGGMAQTAFDPNSRSIAGQVYGSPGGPTPADRTGSGNVLLASNETRYDEAGRGYESQQDVFLNTGLSGGTPTHNLPSGRTVTHTGGGLAANSTTNSHTGTVTLTAGGVSYVLNRSVFDRAGRTTAVASDNTAIATTAFDGASRDIAQVDALGNSIQKTLDPNGNVIGISRIEVCTISGAIAAEVFGAYMMYDVLNQQVVLAAQGADGSLSSNLADTSTLFSLTGFDSRGNATNFIDPKQNTSLAIFDGASRGTQAQQHLRTNGDGTQPIIATVVTEKFFDGNSNFIRLIDDNGGITNWLYDTLDRDTNMILHDGSTRTNAFNLASDIVGYTDENGSVFTNTPDVLGRKTNVTIALAAGVVGTTAQSFQFDGITRLTFGRDTVGATNADTGFSHDSISRKIEEQQTYLGDTRFVTHSAWTSLTGTGFTFPSGREINKSFDALYRKNGITEMSDGSNIAAWQFFGYRTATVALGNGIVTSFMNNAQTRSAVQAGQPTPAWGDITSDQLGYDGSARPAAKRHFNAGAVLVGFTTAYDKSANKLFERALHAESRSNLYSTDSMDRLLAYSRGILASGGGSVSTPITLPNTDSQRAYVLDGPGNWSNTSYTPVGSPPGLDARTHNKLNQVTVFNAPSASTPVLYDQGNNAGTPPQKGNGNIINDGARLNAFDALNRLVTVNRVSDGLQIGGYVYDVIGRRFVRAITNGGLAGTIPNAVSRYLLDGQQIVEELAGTTGSAIIQYVWGQYIDELVQLKALASIGPQPLPAGNYYLLSDLLYRSAALTDSGGSIVEAFDTDAYGNTIPFSGPGVDRLWFTDDDVQAAYSACRYVFTGREWDAETALYFYRARYGSPPLGRFVGRDPIAETIASALKERMAAEVLAQYTNLYALVAGEPTAHADPLGLFFPFTPPVVPWNAASPIPAFPPGCKGAGPFAPIAGPAGGLPPGLPFPPGFGGGGAKGPCGIYFNMCAAGIAYGCNGYWACVVGNNPRPASVNNFLLGTYTNPAGSQNCARGCLNAAARANGLVPGPAPVTCYCIYLFHLDCFRRCSFWPPWPFNFRLFAQQCTCPCGSGQAQFWNSSQLGLPALVGVLPRPKGCIPQPPGLPPPGTGTFLVP